MLKLFRRAVLGVAIVISASSVMAQPISYQGRVNQKGGSPIGNFEIRFEIYPQLAGGTKIGSTVTRSVTFEAADEGVFSFTNLDFGAGVFTAADRWIEIAVRASGNPEFTVLAPRQPLTWAPRSIFAADSGTTLNKAHLNGPVISNGTGQPLRVEGTIQLGGTGTTGVLQLYAAGVPARVMQFATQGSHGGSLRLFSETAETVGIFEADAQGTGGYLRLLGNGGQLEWDGDTGAGVNTGSRLTVTGPVSGLQMDTSVAGDSALVLPASSISSSEILDEPGVASINQPNGVALTGTISPVISRSITVPGPGHVVVLANCNISVQRTSNVNGTLNIGVSTQPSTLPSSQTLSLQMPPSTTTFGQYNFPGGAHAVFQVASGGTFTYYFNARASGYGTPQIFDSTLTLIYVPTAYGTVTPTPATPDAGLTQNGPVFATLSAQEILAEQFAEQRRAVEAMREEQRRMAAELAALRNLVREANQ